MGPARRQGPEGTGTGGGVQQDLGRLVSSTAGPGHARRLVHAGLGAGVASLLWVLEPSRAVSAAAGAGAVACLLGLDLARLAVPRLNLWFHRLLRPLLTPREARGLAGSTWYMAGIFAAVVLFPLAAAVPATWVLALADPAAGWVGRPVGRRPLGTGTLEGFAAFVLVAGAVLSVAVPLPAALLGAIAGGLVEIAPWRVDDNLTIPRPSPESSGSRRRRIRQGLDHGRYSSHCMQDCTICVPCRETAPAPSAPKWRGHRLRLRASISLSGNGARHSARAASIGS